MKTIHPNDIKEQLNNCYDSYDPNWPKNIGDANKIAGFKYHLEHTGGLKLDFELDLNRRGKLGYKMNSVEIVDEPTFMLWMLKWS